MSLKNTLKKTVIEDQTGKYIKLSKNRIIVTEETKFKTNEKVSVITLNKPDNRAIIISTSDLPNSAMWPYPTLLDHIKNKTRIEIWDIFPVSREIYRYTKENTYNIWEQENLNKETKNKHDIKILKKIKKINKKWDKLPIPDPTRMYMVPCAAADKWRNYKKQKEEQPT